MNLRAKIAKRRRERDSELSAAAAIISAPSKPIVPAAAVMPPLPVPAVVAAPQLPQAQESAKPTKNQLHAQRKAIGLASYAKDSNGKLNAIGYERKWRAGRGGNFLSHFFPMAGP